MHNRLYLTVFGAMVGALLATAAPASAQVELTGVVGGLLGGDLDNILAGNASVKGAFDNGPVYGVRLGWVGGFFGFEGSFVGSPSGVAISIPNRPVDLGGKVYYAEANALLIPIPGPISPFFTVGAGWHSYTFDLEAGNQQSDQVTLEKTGWNIGGGLKINIKALTLRGDVRDHITRVGPTDFNVGDIETDLGITEEATLHNVEISAGIGIRF